jgi:hypothetical protein
MEEKLKL